MTLPRLKHFGWGREGEGLTAEERPSCSRAREARFGTALSARVQARRGSKTSSSNRPARHGAAHRCRSAPPSTTTAPRTPTANRIPELVRGLARDYASAPDVVAYPRNEADVAAVLDWAGGARRDA